LGIAESRSHNRRQPKLLGFGRGRVTRPFHSGDGAEVNVLQTGQDPGHEAVQDEDVCDRTLSADPRDDRGANCVQMCNRGTCGLAAVGDPVYLEVRMCRQSFDKLRLLLLVHDHSITLKEQIRLKLFKGTSS